MLAGRDQRVGLDRAVTLDQLLSEWRQRRAATMDAARLRRDHRIAKTMVHIVDQKPRAPIRHAERPARLRDRPCLLDGFEQANLAGPEGSSAAQVHSQRQSWRVHDRSALNSSRGTIASPLIRHLMKVL